MITRRNLLQAVSAIATAGLATNLLSAIRAAWAKPIGLETFTVRNEFRTDPLRTLKRVAEIGYTEIEFNPELDPKVMNSYLHEAGLAAPSGYVDPPKGVEDWNKTVDRSKQYGFKYVVVGDNPRLDSEAWKRRAELYNQCGAIARDNGMQLCYHAHYNEYARVGNTSGYDILLTHCDAKHLNMEMDVFWATYAGVDPIHYWKLYPGRFPLLHIKDLYKNIPVNPHEDPPAKGPNPFAPVGQGKIDWRRIFSHVGEAGTKHIFVEQDTCNMPPLDAARMSYEYLKGLKLG